LDAVEPEDEGASEDLEGSEPYCAFSMERVGIFLHLGLDWRHYRGEEASAPFEMGHCRVPAGDDPSRTGSNAINLMSKILRNLDLSNSPVCRHVLVDRSHPQVCGGWQAAGRAHEREGRGVVVNSEEPVATDETEQDARALAEVSSRLADVGARRAALGEDIADLRAVIDRLEADPREADRDAPARVEVRRRLTEMEARSATLSQDFADVKALSDRLIAERRARDQSSPAHEPVQPIRGQSSRFPWRWAAPAAICTVITGNVISGLWFLFPAYLHPKSVGFVLYVVAILISGAALIRQVRAVRHRKATMS
jgi:hypothetical protein